MLILGGIDPDSGISVQRSTLGGRRDVYAKRIPDRFQGRLNSAAMNDCTGVRRAPNAFL